jgi:AcrR family transcriptional regulator
MANPPRPRRTQAARSRASREKILREATRLFAEYGYRGASLSEIAGAVGMSEPGLLHHFPSKVELLTQVLEERDRADREQYARAGIEGKVNPLDSARAIVAHNQTVPGMVQLFTVLAGESIHSEHPAHDYFVERYRSTREQAVEPLRNGQEKGTVRRDVPAEDLAVMVLAMMDGLQIQWLLDPQQVDMSKVFDRFVDLIAAK